MLQSKRTKPCFYLNVSADVTDMAVVRRSVGGGAKVRPSTNDFIIRAMALAAAEYPLMAGEIVGDYIKIAPQVNIGLAVAAPYGLVVPVVKNINNISIIELAQQSTELIEKAKSNKLAPADLEGACMTLSNLGMMGIDRFIAIVSPGQSGIISVGRPQDALVATPQGIQSRKIMAITLAADHRIVNGDYAAKFLVKAKDLLENAGQMI